MIPSFSLPGTSLGTAEVEDYIKKREDNKSRREAGKKLLEAGISFKHLKHIEKLFRRSVQHMKGLLPQSGHEYLHGIDWCNSLLQQEEPEYFIYKLNTFCLNHGVNAVFCNCVNILIFKKNKPGSIFSNNMGSSIKFEAEIDSS